MYYSLFIYSPTKGHSGCFQISVIMNKAVVNTHVWVDCVFFAPVAAWVFLFNIYFLSSPLARELHDSRETSLVPVCVL